MTTSFTCRVCGNIPLVLNDPKPFAEVAAVYYKITEPQTIDESSLPKFVCPHCYGKLIEIDWFRKTCISSYGRLTAMYNSHYESSTNPNQPNHQTYDAFTNQQSYSSNTMPTIQQVGPVMDYSHPQANTEMILPTMQSTLSENARFSQNPPKPVVSVRTDKLNPAATSSDIIVTHKRLDQLSAKMDSHSAILRRIESYMLHSSFTKPFDLPPISTREDLRHRGNETFEEFERMEQITTNEQLMELDSNLADPAYEAKFFRYIQSVYNLTGKRDGFPFFKTVIRKLIAPTVLVSYSWKGNSRTKKDDQSAVIVNDKNLSFRNMFPNIVRFIYRVVNAADFEYTSEDNEKAFSDYLRQKNIEVKRFLQSNGVQRAPSSRKRKKKNPNPAIDTSSSAAQNQSQDQEIYGVNDTTDGDFSYDEETFSDNGGEGVDIKQEACGSSGMDC